MTPKVYLKSNHVDGRVRLADLQNLNNSLEVDVTGSAGVNLEATFTTPFGSAIRYGGDWVWDLANNFSGYTLDASTSGFDSQELLDSLVTSMASGIEYLGTHVDALSSVLDQVPIAGDRSQSIVLDTLGGWLDRRLEGDVSQVQDYLTARGFTVLSSVSPSEFLQSIVQGGTPSTDLIRLQFQKNRSIAATHSDSGNVSISGLNIELSGSLSYAGQVATSMIFGFDGVGGAYVQEGSEWQAGLDIQGTLNGSASIASLASVEIAAQGTINLQGVYRIDDGDGQRPRGFS